MLASASIMSARIIRAAEINAAGGHNLLLEGAPEAELIRARVEKARERQKARGVLNAKMAGKEIAISYEAEILHNQQKLSFDLSSRQADDLLRIARTIADLAGSGLVCAAHLEEAAAYLPKKES